MGDSLVRARHQLAVVGIIDAIWLVGIVVSYWLCSGLSGGIFGIMSQAGLLFMALLHIVAAPWAILLLCAPHFFLPIPLLLLGAGLVILDGLQLFLRVEHVFSCFPGCALCDYWFLFMIAALFALSVAWTVLAFRYAAQVNESSSPLIPDGGDNGKASVSGSAAGTPHFFYETQLVRRPGKRSKQLAATPTF